MTHWSLTPVHTAEFGRALQQATDVSEMALQQGLLMAISLIWIGGLIAVGFAWKRLARKLTRPHIRHQRLAETGS